MHYFQWQGKKLLLELYIQPGATKNEISGLHGDRLKIRLKANAVENQANQALIKFLAGYFRVPKQSVIIATGLRSRYKRVIVDQPQMNIEKF